MNPVERLIREDSKSTKRILVIGDTMTDLYISGKLAPCQDGCYKFIEDEHVEVPGGAANAARSLHHWRANTRVVYDKRVCTLKTRFTIRDKCVFRHDCERHPFDYTSARKDVVECLLTWRPDGVLLSDYDKGMLNQEFIAYIVRECQSRRIPCVADCKCVPDMYNGCVLKCDSEYYAKHIKSISRQRLVVTCGSRNPIIYERGTPHGLGYDMPPVNCVNHVGAGDCFAAHLILGLTCGLSLQDASAVAHSAGRVYVQSRYNAPPIPDSILLDIGVASISAV